jgi:hypothetical protein
LPVVGSRPQQWLILFDGGDARIVAAHPDGYG